MRNSSGRIVSAALAAGVLTLAGCGGADSEGNGSGPGYLTLPKIDRLESLGAGEGSVNIVSWAGYVEDGSTNKSVDWVTDFEKATGCQVNNKIAGTSDQMVALVKTGEYDVVSASGDISLRLIYGGDVAPVNTDLIANYQDVIDSLKNRTWNSVDGQPYGVPHGRGANLLMYRTDVVDPAPTSWGAVFDPASPYKGTITAYDSPIYIADAALYLMKTKPELKITNPYALDDAQFQAAVDLLNRQNHLIGEYWSDYTKEMRAFKAGNSVLGTTWQVIANLAKADKAPVTVVLPSEGATGWSDTWMVAAKATHPNCAYLWMNHIISPEVNAAAAEWFGQAPSNKLACGETVDPNHCTTYHAADEAYFDQVWYWTTPIARCVDGRTDVTCKDYAAWAQAWTAIKE
jgi:putative spermidine/putrescine transport system substrate-binding protein